MELVIIESPWKANSAAIQLRNRLYAIKAMQDSIQRKEAPYASHLLYTQFLTEEIEHERNLGIEMGLLWAQKAEKTVVYDDLGITSGMTFGIRRAIKEGRPVEFRSLEKPTDTGTDALVMLCHEVADFFLIRPTLMKSLVRSEDVVIARMIYCKIARLMFPDSSYVKIGSIINRDHATVMYSIRQIEQKNHLTKAFESFCSNKSINIATKCQ